MRKNWINLLPPKGLAHTQDAMALGGASGEQNVLPRSLREGPDESSALSTLAG